MGDDLWAPRTAVSGGADGPPRLAADPDLQEGRVVIRRGQLLVGGVPRALLR